MAASLFRHNGTRLAPVYCQIVDNSRFDEVRRACRIGVGFTTKIDLGVGVSEMDVKYFQRKVDDEMRATSQVYGTCATGKVTDRFGNPVGKVRAYEKYIVTGQMSSGYVKTDIKFGTRCTGYTGAKIRPGVKWAGDE